MKPLDELQLEELLKKLPKFSRSAEADKAFHKKLALLAHSLPAKETKDVEDLELEDASNQGSILNRGNIFSWLNFRRFALSGVSLAAVLLVAGTVIAYQPSTTRGSSFYPWKQAAERMELAFARSPLQQVETHLKFSDRRLEEANYMLEKNPELAQGSQGGAANLANWLVPHALAHEEEVELESDEVIWFKETLADMRQEIETASTIVETSIDDAEKAEQALEKIELAVDLHVERLTQMEEKKPKGDRVKNVIQHFADEEDEHLSSIIDARKTVKQARKRKELKVKVRFEKRHEKLEERRKEAEEELREATELFQELSKEDQEKLKEKFERIRQAVETGKVGRAKGLSQAIEEKIEKMAGLKKETRLKLEGKKIREEKRDQERELKQRRIKEQNEALEKDREDAPKGANRAGDEDTSKEVNRAGGEEKRKNKSEEKEQKKNLLEKLIPLPVQPPEPVKPPPPLPITPKTDEALKKETPLLLEMEDIKDFQEIEDFSLEESLKTNSLVDWSSNKVPRDTTKVGNSKPETPLPIVRGDRN